eukprot:2508218-Rhodomonas_salina.1
MSSPLGRVCAPPPPTNTLIHPTRTPLHPTRALRYLLPEHSATSYAACRPLSSATFLRSHSLFGLRSHSAIILRSLR